jgi:hypothetical protein
VISQQDLSQEPPRHWLRSRRTSTPPHRHAAVQVPRRATGSNRLTAVVWTPGLRIAGHHRMGLDCVVRHWRELGQGADEISMVCDRGVT